LAEADRSYASPQEEAAALLSQVLRDLMLPDGDLKAALMRCQFASHLMGWADWRDWCQREIVGYRDEDVLSAHRRIVGTLTWRKKIAGARRALEDHVSRGISGPDTDLEAQDDSTQYDLRFSFDVIKELADSALLVHDLPTGKTDNRYSRRLGKEVDLEQVQRFSPATFRGVFERLRQVVLDFAIHRYTYVQYGAEITDVWQEYRALVDSKLPAMGLGHHLEAIEANLRSDNPVMWRTAALTCRAALEDVSRALWKAPGKKYPYITNAKNQQIEVDEGKFANRIGAYLDQKAVGNTQRRLVQAEAEAIAGIVSALPAAQGDAHAPVTREQARSVALATYLVLGELVTRTDMIPVEQLRRPDEIVVTTDLPATTP